MFSYIGGTFFSYVSHFVNQVSAQLSLYVAIVALAALTLYYLVVGYAVMRGEVHEPIKTIVWRSFKMAMILFVATGAGVYQTEVIGTVNAVSADLMSSVSVVASTSGGTCGVSGTGTTAMFNALDCNFNQLLVPFDSIVIARQTLNILDVATGIMLSLVSGLYFIAVLILFGAVGIVFFTNLLTLNLVLAVGPLFIGALAFEPTKSYFDGWKNKIVYILILQLFMVIFLGLVFVIINGFIILQGFNIDQSASFTGAQEAVSIKALFSLMLVIVLFAYMFTKLDNIANSLVGGGDSASGLGLALATGQLAKVAFKAMSGGKGGGANKGGEIANSPSGGSGLGKGLRMAGRGIGQGAQTAGQSMQHLAHAIAARYRNK